MPEGFETRPVVEAPGPSGRANQPARQLGLVNVQAPRGGNVNQVGSEQRVLAEALKMGGKALGGYLKKKEDDDRILGEMDYAEGRTEAELQELGVNRSRLEGFKALKMKTHYNEWFTQRKKNIEERDFALTTEEYKDQLHADWRELSESLDPEDDETRRLLATFASDGFGKLVSAHVAANTSFASGESESSITNLLVSESQTGDTDSLHEVVGNIRGLAPNLGDDRLKDATLSAVRQTLNEGNFSLYDAMGQEDGLRGMNLDEAEMKSIKSAYKTAQSMQESQHMAEIAGDFNDIMLDVKTKNMSREEATQRLDTIKGSYRLQDGYMRTLFNTVNKEFFNKEYDEEKAAILYDPTYLQAKTNLIRAVGYEGLQSTKGINQALKIADQFKLPHDMVMDDLQEVVNADRQFQNRQDAQLDEILREQEKTRETDRRAGALRNSGFGRLNEYSTTEQQRALEQERDVIVQSVMNNPRFDSNEEKTAEVIRQHVGFLRNVPIKDDRVKQDFKVVGQSSPVAEDGTLNEAHMQAFQYYSAMEESGLSDRTIREYTGDGYDYLSVASELANGATDPKTALITAWEQTQVPKDKRPTPQTDIKAATEKWDSTKEQFFESIEPSIVAGWFGAESDGKYSEVLTWQVKQAAKASTDMDRWAKNRISLYSTTYPAMKEDAVMGLVKRDLSRWEYVMGNMVPPKDGKSLTEAMGLDTHPGALKTNSAMLMYMRDNAEILFPEGTDQRGWWKRFKSGAGEALDTAIFEPEKILSTGAPKSLFANPIAYAQDVAFATSEKEQRIANDIKMIDVTPLSNGQVLVSLYHDTDKEELVGVPLAIPAQDIGDWYKEQSKQRQFEKHLPRR